MLRGSLVLTLYRIRSYYKKAEELSQSKPEEALEYINKILDNKENLTECYFKKAGLLRRNIMEIISERRYQVITHDAAWVSKPEEKMTAEDEKRIAKDQSKRGFVPARIKASTLQVRLG